MKVKLEQFIAAQSHYSRRDILALIKEGKIRCNGEVVTSMSHEIIPGYCHVQVEGKFLSKPHTLYYYKYNKPKNVICTLSDPKGRRCLKEVLQGFDHPLFPVGRLDRKTTGLLLLTNDGQFSQEVIHPSKSIQKRYYVELDKALSQFVISQLRYGFFLEDGPVQFHDIVIESSKQLLVTLTEGRNRIIRRAFEFFGYDVRQLKRLSIGAINLGHLKLGAIEPLSNTEVASILKGK